MKVNKGITLIALVVTIVILLILAGIALNFVLGDNGIVKKSIDARNNTVIAKEKDNIGLAWGALFTENLGDASKITAVMLQKEINKTITGNENDTKVTVEDSTMPGQKFKITYTDTVHVYYLDNFGTITDESGEVAEIPSPYDIFDFTTAVVDGKTRGYISLKSRGSGYEEAGTSTYEKVVIPSKWSDGTDVTDIAANGFAYISGLKEVVIPSSIDTIGDYAFSWIGIFDIKEYAEKTPTLEKVKIEANSKLNSIGKDAFAENIALKEINLPDSVANFGIFTFDKCISLTALTLPSLVTIIPDGMFDQCSNLTSVVLPTGVTTIKRDAFSNCTSLNNVVIPNNVSIIEDYALFRCTSLNNLTITDSVKKVGQNAFGFVPYFDNQPDGPIYIGKNLLKYKGTLPTDGTVTIKDGTEIILNYAFDNYYKLKQIILPNTIKIIEDSAFTNCSGLTNITMTNSVERIGNGAFYYCSSLNNVVLPNTLTTIDDNAFYRCTSLTNLTMSDNVTSVGDNSFYNVPYYTTTVADGVVYIGKCLYKYKGTMPLNTNIIVKDGTVLIKYLSFTSQTNLISITLPNTVVSIERAAFSGCNKLTNITMSNKLEDIGYETFKNCSSLKSIVLPNTLTYIGPRAFDNCTSISTITLPSSIKNMYFGVFNYWTASQTINVQFKEGNLPAEWDTDWKGTSSAKINYLP